MSQAIGFVIIPATQLESPELLRSILEDCVRSHITGEIVYDEVEEIINSTPRSIEDLEYKFTAVAWSPKTTKALGMMSLTAPTQTMRDFAQSSNPIELTNAYTLRSVRGLGIGTSLVQHLEKYAKSHDYTEIVLNSGPRFTESGWPFWRKVYGEPITTAKNYYGPNIDAPVWRKVLGRTK